MKNYIKLQKWSLLYSYFVFVDAKEYLADTVFIREKVNVHFGKECIKQGCDYAMIFCKVRKRDEEKFLHSLELLENKMLLSGHPDYLEFCHSLLQRIEAGSI